jgi:glutamyl-Q tRNA(Asp) synthetase
MSSWRGGIWEHPIIFPWWSMTQRKGITDVVRGEDLESATAIHVVLQRLLNLPTPQYHHHRLIRDDAGKRLAKRDDARALSTYRAQGLSSEDIRRLIGL